MPSTFNGLKRFASFRSKKGQASVAQKIPPLVDSGGDPGQKPEGSSHSPEESCVSSPGDCKNVRIPPVASGGSRKRSPNTRTASSEAPDLVSKRHLGSSSSQNQEKCISRGENHESEGCPVPSKTMETDACATETGTPLSASSSGYSSTRSSNTTTPASSKSPHLNRGTSKSAETSNIGKENRIPSMSTHSTSRGGVNSSPVPVIKNRPNRSFVGYVSPYEQFLRFTETDPKYRSEKSQGKILGLYKFCGEIGAGNFSKVKLGIHQLTKERVAIKIIEKSRVQEKMERMLTREVRSMEVLNHHNLIRLYEVMETGTKIYLISEWAPAGDLYSKVTLRGKLPEYDAKPIFRQILAALLYMHGNGIIHRDLKAENVFFSTGTVCKVGDFGFSTTGYRGQLLSTFCGSPPYAAPELYRDEAYEGGPVDAWALGVLLYFMTEGRLPFIGTSIPNLKRNILNGEYMMSGNLTDELMDLIQKILQQRPSRRLTVAEMIIHPWLQPESYENELFSVNTSTDSSQGDSSLGSMDGTESICSMTSMRQTHCSIIRRDTNGKLFPTTKHRAICRSIPTKEQIIYKLVSQKEIQAYEILQDIGIPESMIEAHRVRGVRSYVIGIYRMILHKLEKGDEIDFAKFCAHSMSSSMTNFNSAGQNEITSPRRFAHHTYGPPNGHPVQPSVNKGPVKMNTNHSPIRYKEEPEEDEENGEVDQKPDVEQESVEPEQGPEEEEVEGDEIKDLGELGLDEIGKSKLRSSNLSKASSKRGEVETVVNNCQAVPSTTCAIL